MSLSVGRSTILVADDNAANRDLLSDLLAEEGYRIICAQDGDQAMQALQENSLDLALLDVMMPGHTGFDICTAIKSQLATRFVPVVLVTGLTSIDERIQGIKCGADDFLSKPINKQELLARVHSLLRLKEYTDELDNAETVLFSLALSIEAKDPYTRGHCDRLARYAIAFGRRVQLTEDLIFALRRAATVHDIGKIGVPEHILTKAGPLTEEEWVIMKRHSVTGERICSPLKSFRLVLPIIRHHHEKLDGSGYPDGLRGEEIPVTARILQIVDVFDALTTNRPYREAMQPKDAFAAMEEEVRKGWWDGVLLRTFQELWEDPAFHQETPEAGHAH